MSEPFTAHAFDNEDAMPPLEDEHGNTIVAGAAPPATFDDMPALIRQGCENEAHSCGMVEEEEEQSHLIICGFTMQLFTSSGFAKPRDSIIFSLDIKSTFFSNLKHRPKFLECANVRVR